eukprot:gene18939-18855_t
MSRRDIAAARVARRVARRPRALRRIASVGSAGKSRSGATPLHVAASNGSSEAPR